MSDLPSIPASLQTETGVFQPINVSGRETFAFCPHPLRNPEGSVLVQFPQRTAIQRAFDVLNTLLATSGGDNLFCALAAATSGIVDKESRSVGHRFAALHHGKTHLTKGLFTSQLLTEMNAACVQGHDGEAADGFRAHTNWLVAEGHNVPYVNCPPDNLNAAIVELMGFMNATVENKDEALLRASLITAQFLILHPFADGNGRTANVIIPLYLWKHGLIGQPLLDLSAWFRLHRGTKSVFLRRLCLTGDWTEWHNFFLEGLVQAAAQLQGLAALVAQTSNKGTSKSNVTQDLESIFKIRPTERAKSSQNDDLEMSMKTVMAVANTGNP